MAKNELLRCVVCDITNDINYSADHITLLKFEDTKHAAVYLNSLKFWPQASGDLICDDCRGYIKSTLAAMETEDESW